LAQPAKSRVRPEKINEAKKSLKIRRRTRDASGCFWDRAGDSLLSWDLLFLEDFLGFDLGGMDLKLVNWLILLKHRGRRVANFLARNYAFGKFRC
jgi:hypothetical protein